MRGALDRLYAVALWLAALCLLAIGLMVGVQVGARVVDAVFRLIGLGAPGLVILSMAEIAGYLLSAASFLALAGTLKSGVHIRVTMVLSVLSDPARRIVESLAFAAAAMLSAYMTWHMAHFALVSFRFDEVSTGVVRVPLAIPQTAMAVGLLILTIAIIDELILVWRSGRPSFSAAEDAVTLSKET
jgi:TRAP-type C4-dicarboxylate transport system permease small subunit